MTVSNGLLVGPQLPPGRHRCTADDVQETFVDDPRFAGSTTRRAAWNDYLDGVALLRSVVRVHATWIGGSFTTDVANPSDVDATFLINSLDYRKAVPREKAIVDSFVLPLVPGSLDGVRQHGLKRLDSFVLQWRPLAKLEPKTDPEAASYCVWRGYWDDFWQRQRSGAKYSAPKLIDAMPRRGYLEVIGDDYAR